MPQIMQKTELFQFLGILREYFVAVYQDRLVKTILFGSQARGEATSDSDIDVLVVLKGDVDIGKEIEKTGEFVANLCLEHEQVIGKSFVSEEEFKTRNSPLLMNIRREGIEF